jgi:hypothetical protein
MYHVLYVSNLAFFMLSFIEKNRVNLYGDDDLSGSYYYH